MGGIQIIIYDINLGHVIAKNLGNRSIGEGIDRIRKLDILQEGTNRQNDYAYINSHFEGVIDTLNIVGKKVRFQTNSNRSPTIGALSVLLETALQLSLIRVLRLRYLIPYHLLVLRVQLMTLKYYLVQGVRLL